MAEKCESQRGSEIPGQMRCSTDRDQIRLWLEQTKEMMHMVSYGGGQVALHIDFEIDMDLANAKGFFFEAEQLVDILDLHRSIYQVKGQFQGKEENYPVLCELFAFERFDQDLMHNLEKILDPEGEIRPDASKELQTLCNAIGKKERSLMSTGNKLFSSAKNKGILGDTALGIKNGRMVLPVLAEHKKKVQGLFHDQSNTGKILYIEPLELVELNNELSELQLQKRQEIIKILRKISAEILPQLPVLKRAQHTLSIYDFIRAKARISVEQNWDCPAIDQPRHELIQARHPLLEMRLKAEKNKLVPMDLFLNDQQRILVISGPNAGGKSVALKTVGLLQFMLQSGLPVPLNAESKMMHFNSIFVDIGDDQSIESDLSTYSSHLKAAKHMINFSDNETLVLIDEIGTGTDPMFGGPMAEAILEALHNRMVFGVITTHFSNIKSRASELKYAVNGAMLFDTEKLIPQYKLLIGQAGSSFAYEVAANIGMNKKLIKRARQLTNTIQYDLDLLLGEVQMQKEDLERERAALKAQKEKAEHFEAEYRQLKDELELRKKELLRKAKDEAEQIIHEANKDIERTIREIKESGAEKEKTKKLRSGLEKRKASLKIVTASVPLQFKEGDRVRIKETDAIGEIVSLNKNKAEVIIGAVKTRINTEKLEKVSETQKRKASRYLGNAAVQERQKNFSSELDIRGMRTEEALKEVENWIDSAIILGFEKLRLIHGKGEGILKQQIRTLLKPNPAIDSISYERVDLGGEGVSIIVLK